MLNFRIIRLDIAQSYFTGTVESDSGVPYKANIQNQRRDKIIRLPPYTRGHAVIGEKVLVRVSGPRGLYVEDWLAYGGESEWLEIDSDAITYYLADHQDEMDTIEIDLNHAFGGQANPARASHNHAGSVADLR